MENRQIEDYRVILPNCLRNTVIDSKVSGQLKLHVCSSNIKSKVTECWLVNEKGIFLNFPCEEGKITRSRLVFRLLSNSLCYREVSKNFHTNGVPFRDTWGGIYQRIIRHERKWKHQERHAVVQERFQKVGEWKKLLNKFRRVRNRCPKPNILAVSRWVTERPRLPESNAGITVEISKIKRLSKVY